MSLDLTVLGADGAPERSVSISVDLHAELMRLAAEVEAKHLARFQSYYTDAEVPVEGLAELSREIGVLRHKARSPDLVQLLSDLDGLVAHALANRRAVHAIAD